MLVVMTVEHSLSSQVIRAKHRFHNRSSIINRHLDTNRTDIGTIIEPTSFRLVFIIIIIIIIITVISDVLYIFIIILSFRYSTVVQCDISMIFH
jgi:hypothetical protein